MNRSRSFVFAAAGLIPGSLVGWEIWSNYQRVEDEKRKEKMKLGIEGSMERLIEEKVSTLDLVLRRQNFWRLGPIRGLVSLATPGRYDSVGVIITDKKSGDVRVLEADFDGSITFFSLASLFHDTSNNEIIIRPLLWPRTDKIEVAANLFATSALLQCGRRQQQQQNKSSILSTLFFSSLHAASDQRFAPYFFSSRTSWPSAPSHASLPVKLSAAVSPAATLIVELYCSLGVLPPQYKTKPFLASDFAEDDIPFRKGARFDTTSLSIKEAN
mmetsp:Transcript_871/g.1214  ORF Transcript_871/g.1214 Transcript_871/m.1214 type:complete len:271 (+) Transcript_871:41-853(+)